MNEINSVVATNSLTDWITAISTAFIAVGIMITLWSIVIDHKRSRRQRAIDIMISWNSLRDLIGDHIIRSLNNEQLTKLFERKGFEVDASLKPALELFFLKIGILQVPVKEDFLPIQNKKIYLDDFYVNILRIYASKSVNFLEIVSSAWRSDVADKDIIEEEFEKIFFPLVNDISMYDGYIKAAGAFPSMRALIKHYLDGKEKQQMKRKKKWHHFFR